MDSNGNGTTTPQETSRAHCLRRHPGRRGPVPAGAPGLGPRSSRRGQPTGGTGGTRPESGVSPIAALARQRDVELLTPVTTQDPEFVTRLTELAPDAAAVVAYGAILRQNVLD